jgi:RNA-directed DNA polymerase
VPTPPGANRRHRAVPQTEGNEGKREERPEVGAARSSKESGEPGRRDPLERRGCRITEPLEGKIMGAMTSNNVCTKQQRIAELARIHPEVAFTSLAHHMDLDWLKQAYGRTRKDGAVGVDGVSGKAYGEDLEANLQSLLNRAKHGDTYKAPPVRRVYIPKADGSQRPLGIPTFEDKVLQRAVVMLMEPLYEQDFLDCSYGFRPGRSAHMALEAIWQGLMDMDGGWVLDVDIRKYFDTLDHEKLREILDLRMKDGVLRRLIGKWLKAGVLEKGCVTHPETGSPQGGVISPMLANIYLHEVLDVWFEREVKPRLRGRAFLVRYADDFVMGFAREEDARRVLEVLPKRFERYGLKIHPDKTRLVEFRKPREPRDPNGGPGHFDFLGFTHYWGMSKNGRWVVKRKTAKSRMSRALATIGEWMRKNRHLPVREQWRTINQKLVGHYRYYGITGNSKALGNFRYEVGRRWRCWLNRRSQRARMIWERMNELLARFPLAPAISYASRLRQQRS